MNKHQGETVAEFRVRNAAYMREYNAGRVRKPLSESAKARILQRQRERRKDPAYLAQIAQWQRDYLARKKANGTFKPRPPERNRLRDWKRKYGLTEASHAALLESQGGTCAICKRPQGARRMDVDHCHENKRVRGLLCRNCNLVLGHGRNDPVLLRAAAKYLEAAPK